MWRHALLLAAALCIFHTLPWIALNMSEARSLERFKTLPLGGGRTENTVAYWYAQHHDFNEAKRWLKRSLEINPQESRAMDLYARIAIEEHNPRTAVQLYLVALTIRPDKIEYWRQLGYSVMTSGGPVAALGQLDTLMVGHQDHPALWLEREILLRACGRTAEAADARKQATRLAPGISCPVDSLPIPAVL
jgi:tetratricopeptide (TPR) repeat protein